MSNQATHYWEYQLRDEVCDCENGTDDDDEGPLPPHRYDLVQIYEYVIIYLDVTNNNCFYPS